MSSWVSSGISFNASVTEAPHIGAAQGEAGLKSEGIMVWSTAKGDPGQLLQLIDGVFEERPGVGIANEKPSILSGGDDYNGIGGPGEGLWLSEVSLRSGRGIHACSKVVRGRPGMTV